MNSTKYKSEIEFLVFENDLKQQQQEQQQQNNEHNFGSKNRIFSLTPSDIQTASHYFKMNDNSSSSVLTTQQQTTNQNNHSNINENTTNEFEIRKTNNLLDSILSRNNFVDQSSEQLKNLKIEIDDTYFDNHINTMNTKYSSSTNSGVGMFHPTWDEWKQRAQLANEKSSKQKHESVLNQNTSSLNKQELKDYKNMIENNQTSSKSTKSILEEYYTQHSKSNQMTQQQQDFYNPPSPILIRNSNTNQLEYISQSSLSSKPRSPRHFPVAGIDFLPVRPPSPVNLSSCTLAKEPPLEIKTENEARKFPKPEPEREPEPEPEPKQEPAPIVLEAVQQKKIKTILSTRKESAPNLTGWRTESESDSDAQSRLLARASGSIPIEYISIRRDPKPDDKKIDKTKKSITTGTNTSCDRGKRIAATNTNQDELPQYNLHVSLDSLFVKSRQEASTLTDIKNKNAATETSDVCHKDACTVTDIEKSPSPPPPPPPQPKQSSEPKQEPKQEQIIYTHRKSRFTEWETASNPPPPVETSYRLEILAKSPCTSQTRREVKQVFHQSYNRVPSTKTSFNYSINETIRADDDDRIVFGTGSNSNSSYHHEEYHNSKRSGSFPCLIPRPIVYEQTINNGNSSRYVKHIHTTSYSPFISRQVERVTYHQPQFELGIMPLTTTRVYNSNSNSLWNEQFNEFNSKFNQIFGNMDMGKTQRYYKYSRTTTDNGQQIQNMIKQQMPSFGEVYHQRFNSASSYASNSLNANQSQQQTRGPIIEIPVTPTSTMGKSSTNQFFSSRHTSSNGPIITSLSRNGSTTNLNSNMSATNLNASNLNAGNYYASSMQQRSSSSSFEPVVQRVNSNKIITTSTTTTSQSGAKIREEEDEELVRMSGGGSVESERQFRPINETIKREAHYRSSSSNGQAPINVVNTSRTNSFNSTSNASSARKQNYSSSYEFSSSKQNVAN